MNYFKWHSDDNTIVLEKFKGNFTTEFLELSEKFLVDFNEFDQIKLISDVGLANFIQVSPYEASKFASDFIRSIPDGFPVELCFIIGTAERNDMDVLTAYANPISQSTHIDFKLLPTLEEAQRELHFSKDHLDQMKLAIQDWLESLA